MKLDAVVRGEEVDFAHLQDAVAVVADVRGDEVGEREEQRGDGARDGGGDGEGRGEEDVGLAVRGAPDECACAFARGEGAEVRVGEGDGVSGEEAGRRGRGGGRTLAEWKVWLGGAGKV